MTDSLWVEATRDIEAENESRRVAYVATAAADVWPFLAAAQSRPEYASRKALAAERIDAAVEVVAERGTGAFDRLRDGLIAQLDADFDTLYNSTERVAAREAEAMRRASQAIGAEIMRRETAPGFGKTAAGLDNLGDNRAKPFGKKDDDDEDDDKKSSKTAGEYGGGSPKSGDKATCHKDDLPIQFFDGQWMHLSGGPSHNDVYPATPRERAEKQGAKTAANTYVCLYKGQRKEVQAETTYEAQKKAAAEFGAKKTFEVDVMLAQKDGKDVVHDPARLGALIDSITDDDIKTFAITLGDMDDKPYAATCPNKDCDNHGTSFVHDDLALGNDGDDETAHCPDCGTPLEFEQRKQGAGRRRNDFSLSDAKNEAGEWTMSPEQIRAEMAANNDDDYDPYGDDDDYRGRGRRGSRGRHPFDRNAARDIHDLRRDVGDAMKRYLHPDYHADGQAVLDRTHDSVLDHLADMYGWTVENAQSHKEHHDKVADSVAAHVYETAPFTEHAPPRHHASLHTAEEHGGYHLEEGDGGWYVVNHIGERKNKEPMDHDAALKYQRALMVNVPGAKEDAERHEDNNEKPKHSMRLHPAKADGAHISAFAIACGDWGHWAEHYTKVADMDYQRHTPKERHGSGIYEFPSGHKMVVRADGSGQFVTPSGEASERTPEQVRDTLNQSLMTSHFEPHGVANPKRTRVACKKCVAGHDPSGGDCDYCDGQGSLDLTLAMVKAADGWDQGLTREAFARTAMDVACPDCGGTGSVPAGGWEPADQVDNGYTKCGTCGGTGMVPYEAPRGMESQTGEFDFHGSRTANDRVICPYCDYSGSSAEVGKHIADEGPRHQQRGTVTDQLNDRIRHGHLTRSGEGPARPAGDSRHFHTIEPEGDKWHIYRMPRSQVGQGRGRNKVKVSTHDTHEQAVAALNRLKGNVTAVNTDATGADRYRRTPAPRVPDWISQWSDDEAKADTSQHNEGRAGADSANPVKNHAIEEPDSRYVYKPVAKVGWLDFTSAQQMLGQLDGRDVALTYDDDYGITTCGGRLAFAGKSVTVTSANGKTVTVPVQHVLNVAASGFSATDPTAGQLDRAPGMMDHLVHAWPSGAMASRTVTANPYSPNLNPYTTDGPGHPDQGGTPGDSVGGGSPSDPEQATSQNPTTTRPRVKPSTDYTDGENASGLSGQQPPSLAPGWEPSGQGGSSTAPWRAAASLREAEEWYASPVRQKVAAKAKAIADTIQDSNPGMGRGQALGFAVETIRTFPRVVGGIAPSALGGVLDRYLMELSQA